MKATIIYTETYTENKAIIKCDNGLVLNLNFDYTNEYYIGKYGICSEFKEFLNANNNNVNFVFDMNGNIIFYKPTKLAPIRTSIFCPTKNKFWKSYGARWESNKGQEVHGWNFKSKTFIRIGIDNKEEIEKFFNKYLLYMNVEPTNIEIE